MGSYRHPVFCNQIKLLYGGMPVLVACGTPSSSIAVTQKRATGEHLLPLGVVKANKICRIWRPLWVL